MLASWEGEIPTVSREALARLLTAAHDRLRCVRFQLDANCVNALSFAGAARLDIDLPESVPAVLTAVGRMRQGVRALLHETVATAYVEAVCAGK